MMMLRLNTGIPPGGIQYIDPRTDAARWMDDHTWLDARVREVIAFRAANPAIYPEKDWTTPKFVEQQIIDFNCVRLNNNPLHCIDHPAKAAPSPAPAIAPRLCPDCNLEIMPKYCPTCSGKRITGYECPNCKKEFPR